MNERMNVLWSLLFRALQAWDIKMSKPRAQFLSYIFAVYWNKEMKPDKKRDIILICLMNRVNDKMHKRQDQSPIDQTATIESLERPANLEFRTTLRGWNVVMQRVMQCCLEPSER